MNEVFRIKPERVSGFKETPDEALWANEYERSKLPTVTRLATCNCPGCNREVRLQSALITGGDLTSLATDQKVVFFGDRAIMDRLTSKDLKQPKEYNR